MSSWRALTLMNVSNETNQESPSTRCRWWRKKINSTCYKYLRYSIRLVVKLNPIEQTLDPRHADWPAGARVVWNQFYATWDNLSSVNRRYQTSLPTYVNKSSSLLLDLLWDSVVPTKVGLLMLQSTDVYQQMWRDFWLWRFCCTGKSLRIYICILYDLNHPYHI